MTLILGLFAAGIILIVFEVFLPGGVLGVLGGICVLAGVIVSYNEFGLVGGFVGFAAAMVLTCLVLYFEFKILPKTAMGKSLFLKRTIEAKTQADVADDSVVGQECTTLTPLAPTGVVVLNGKKVEASSKSGFIEKNVNVRIVGKETFRIIVSKI